MNSSFTFLRVRGIPIGANFSWLLIVGLIVYSLTTFLFPHTYPGLSSATYLVMGIAAAVLFFASIVLHELGHAFQALKEGMKIDGITLWLFGGVARFRGMFPSAGAEFRIAIAGPVVSAVIAALFGALALLGDSVEWPGGIQGVVDYLARINALVLAFNLVPALPLDGGRVLRSWLWHRQGSFAAATASAATAGKAFGFVLIAVGGLNLLAGAGTGGLWFAFLGWFLIQAARAEGSFVVAHQALGGRRVADLMTRDPAVVAPATTVARFLEEAGATGGHPVYPVAEDGRLLGLVTIERAGAVPEGDRDRRSVRDIALTPPQFAVLEAEGDLTQALGALETSPGRAPVVDHDRLVGILSLSDVRRALRIEEARGPISPTGSRRTGLLVWALVTAIMLLAGAYLYQPPVVVVGPGATLDVTQDITIDGIEPDEINGEYLLTSVRLDQPNALGALYAMVFTDNDVIALSEVVPAGQDEEEFARRQREMFGQSRLLAAAAAASAAGREVTFTGTGALVQEVLPESPAADEFESGDVIVAVNGNSIEVAPELRAAIGSRPSGTSFLLTVERGSQRLEIEVESGRLSGIAEGTIGLGVVVVTRDLDVELPFEIRFEERNIGGPSAGLVYALAIADMLDPDDIAAGRSVGATGTIESGGGVGPVGGVGAKAIALRDAGADLFLVPEDEVDLVTIDELEVLGVSDLGEALEILEASET